MEALANRLLKIPEKIPSSTKIGLIIATDEIEAESLVLAWIA